MRHKRLFVSFVSSWSPFLCILALGTSLLVAQQPNTTRNPLNASADVIAAGRVVFDQTCQSCHAPGGTGDRGPALNTGVFGHGSEDGDLFRTIREGLAGTQMPPFRGLTDEQIWQIVVYLRSLSGVRAGEPAANATTTRGNRASGETLFFGKANCASCHQVNGRGGIVGPDLSTVARAPADALRQKILNPAAPFAAPSAAGRGGPVGRGGAAARPLVTVAKTKDGREIRGVRRNEDTFSLQMVDASGTLHLLDKLQLADVRVENTSLMPGDYGTKLAAGEIDDLVAYLSTLRERDLTITSTSTVTGGLTFNRLVNADAEPQNWLMYWGNFRGTHYSGLRQITAANVGQLQTAWTFPMPGPSVLEAVPLVVDGVMYTTQPGEVVALDARTGRQIWRYVRPQKVKNPYEINPFNRGVAVARQPAVLRDARRRAGGARRENRTAALGNADRRHDARPQPDERAARREGQGARRDHRRRIRPARIPGCLRRRNRKTGVALVLRARAGRVRPRHVAGRQLEAWRQSDVAHRLVRCRAQHACTGPSEIRDRKSIDRCAANSTICSATRSWRSIPTPVSASGTISSRRMTATTGTRRRI